MNNSQHAFHSTNQQLLYQEKLSFTIMQVRRSSVHETEHRATPNHKRSLDTEVPVCGVSHRGRHSDPFTWCTRRKLLESVYGKVKLVYMRFIINIYRIYL